MQAESFNRLRKERRRKNPDQSKEGKLKRHAQPTSLAPSKHILHQPYPPHTNTHLLPSSHSHACLSITSSQKTPNPRLFWNNRVWGKSQKAWNLSRKSHNGQNAWNLTRKSHNGKKTWNLTRKSPWVKKHESPYGNLMKSHKEISYPKCTAQSMKSHKG